MTDRALKKQKQRLSFHKELLRPWLPLQHFSEEGARELQGKSAGEMRSHFLKHFGGCDPESLKTAAEFFGLNYLSEADCLVLAAVLAEVLFGKRGPGRKKGNAPTWNGARLILLGQKYRELKKNYPKDSDYEIAEKICTDTDFKEYRKNPIAIQKKLRDAEAELFHMERSPAEYHWWLKVSGENSVMGSIKRRPSKRSH
jgi:hypothetical protein